MNRTRTIFGKSDLLVNLQLQHHPFTQPSPFITHSLTLSFILIQPHIMSMHFAPQWVKPIKPTGSATTPTSDLPPSIQQQQQQPQQQPPTKQSQTPAPTVPFPALASNQRSVSPNTSTNPPPLSYSRVTHAPLSPGLATDNSYFPYGADTPNGNGNGHPFRYTREQILSLYDGDKVKERPIELVQMADDGVLVSKNVAKPIGLRDLTEIEKRVSLLLDNFSSSSKLSGRILTRSIAFRNDYSSSRSNSSSSPSQ